MHDNIGGKIQALAKVIMWIGIVVSGLLGLLGVISSFSMYGGGAIVALISLIGAGLGALGSWVGSFILYGFGSLINSSQETADELKKLNRTQL